MGTLEDLDALPPAYVRLLHLLDAGLAPAAIAAELDVEEAGVPALIELAQAKLATRRSQGGVR